MKESRGEFVRALKFCRRNEKKISDERLLEVYKNKHVSQFWKQVKALRGQTGNAFQATGGCRTAAEVADMFGRKFGATHGGTREIVDSPFRPNVAFKKKFTVNVLCEAIDKLNIGIGYDGVHSNHLKFMSF